MGFGWLLKTTPFHVWWLPEIVFKTLCPSTTKMSWGWGQTRRDSDWLWILRALVRTPIHICVFTSKVCAVCIVTQSCPTLCDPYHPPGSSVHRDSPGKKWVATPFSRGSSQPRDWTQVSHTTSGFFTSWTTREAQGLQCLSLYPYLTTTLWVGTTIIVIL